MNDILYKIAGRVAALTQPLSDRYDYGSHPFLVETKGEKDEDESEDGSSRDVTSRSIITHPPTSHPRKRKHTI